MGTLIYLIALVCLIWALTVVVVQAVGISAMYDGETLNNALSLFAWVTNALSPI